MAYKQDKAFSTAKAGKVSGECLKNIRLGYGINAKYPTAIKAWYGTVQHKDRSIPSGVAVPLFYTYLTAGHVNVRLPDGRIYSDGAYYDNIGAYESTHPKVRYLGWGETLNDVRVISYVPDPAPTRKRVYFSPAQVATFYKVSGGTYAMKCADGESWAILEDLGNKVRVNSKLAGGDCWVYLTYTATGKPIPGRSVK